MNARKRRHERVGERYGMLVIVKALDAQGKVLAVCDCGVAKEYYLTNIMNPAHKSCGCHRKAIKTSFKHGMSKSNIYIRWRGMMTRCYDEKCPNYKRYGGRGIQVCQRWHDFENYFADMGFPPTNKHSIDRIDNDGNYSPENCRWATAKQQAQNRRPVDQRGEKNPVAKLNQESVALAKRLYRDWGLSQGEVAYFMGIAQTTVSRLIRGVSYA